MAPPRLQYRGPEADKTLARSHSLWQAYLHAAKSMHKLPEASLRLESVLARVPALPVTIPLLDALQGFSTWENQNASCALVRRTEPAQKFRLRRRQPTVCRLNASENFRSWEGQQNNGIMLLFLGWAYVMSASLAERQGLKMEFRASARVKGALVDLGYASREEVTWWATITRPGVGWSIEGGEVAPWAVLVEDTGVEIAGDIDGGQRPPTAEQAAAYLARFSSAYGLGTQCAVALAAALTLPLHDTAYNRAAVIDLPRPSLVERVSQPSDEGYPAEFDSLSHYMTLSLNPGVLGSCLWSVFWDPQVPCTLAGAWIGPIVTILKPIITANHLELLAKVLALTPVAPLWLGLALCGQRSIINSIIPSLEEARSYPHTRPNLDAVAWTGVAQSFIGMDPTRPCLRRGRVLRADVWRLRHDCYTEYQEADYSHTPQYGWPPFGEMLAKDVELEIRSHLTCSHRWRYAYWTWLHDNSVDYGLSRGYAGACSIPPAQKDRSRKRGTPRRDMILTTVSEKVTKAAFWWCCDQVEKGFGNTLVPFHSCSSWDDPPEHSTKDTLDLETIQKWVDSQRDQLLLDNLV